MTARRGGDDNTDSRETREDDGESDGGLHSEVESLSITVEILGL
jgi:hypothetical protein